MHRKNRQTREIRKAEKLIDLMTFYLRLKIIKNDRKIIIAIIENKKNGTSILAVIVEPLELAIGDVVADTVI
jgi:ribosomal protein L18